MLITTTTVTKGTGRAKNRTASRETVIVLILIKGHFDKLNVLIASSKCIIGHCFLFIDPG